MTLELKRCELYEIKLKSELEKLAFQWNQTELQRKKKKPWQVNVLMN